VVAAGHTLCPRGFRVPTSVSRPRCHIGSALTLPKLGSWHSRGSSESLSASSVPLQAAPRRGASLGRLIHCPFEQFHSSAAWGYFVVLLSEFHARSLSSPGKNLAILRTSSPPLVAHHWRLFQAVLKTVLFLGLTLVQRAFFLVH
jgi:hypothetical protein